MGAFDAKRPDEITIHDEKNWEPGESCTARTIVRAGDEEWVLNQQMLIAIPKGNRAQRRASGFQKQKNVNPDIRNNTGATDRLWVQKMLTGWNFTANGMPVPFEESGKNEVADKRMSKIMQMLDQSYIDYIYEQIMAAQPKEAKEEESKEDESEDEEEDEDEEGSAFFANASTSIDGVMLNHERTNQASMNGNPFTETTETKHRNFLAKS